MDFARQQRDPARHLIGITFVVLVHVIVIYALVTGLARKAVEVIKKPLTATIIEEIKTPPPPPPPPPPRKIVEPPKMQQTYVPPPSDPTTMVTELAQLQSTQPAARVALAQNGITAQNWWAVNTASLLQHIKDLVSKVGYVPLSTLQHAREKQKLEKA